MRLVFDTYYSQAVRFAVLSGLSTEAARDCAQEAFVHAFQRRHQLRDPAAFPLWFHRIVTHQVLDILRGQRLAREQPLDVNEDVSEDWERCRSVQPDEDAILAEERTRLWQAVQLLAPKYRVPLVLRYYSDFSFREIAVMMGKREGTIRVIVHRALQQLRTHTRETETTREVQARMMPHIEAGQA